MRSTPHVPLRSSLSHDAVRRHWEEHLTRTYLATHMDRIRQAARTRGRGLRVLDLGCGTGEGWDLLTSVSVARDERTLVLEASDIETYLGFDMCQDMVDQARLRLPWLSFARTDLGHLKGAIASETPFDLYFSSNGSLSSLSHAELGRLVTVATEHARGPALLVLDVLGKFSPGASHGWGGLELRSLLEGNPAVAKRLRRLSLYDRGVLVTPGGALRQAVNSLLEPNRKTDMKRLEAHLPGPLPAETRTWATEFQRIWNALVRVFTHLDSRCPAYAKVWEVLEGASLPRALVSALVGLIRYRQELDRSHPEIPLCNSLEPHLATLLRLAEQRLQQGLGCGHGLLALVELA